MVPLWNILDTTSSEALKASTGPWVDAVLPVVEDGYRESHRVAVEFVEDYRHAMAPAAEPMVSVSMDEFPAERAKVSVIVTGPVEVERQLPDMQASERGLVSSTGAAVRITADGGRDAVLDAVELDDEAIGYARKTDSNPCHFCALLASRGAVYKKDSFALANRRFAGDGVAKTHDHCQCTMRPVYDADDDMDDEAKEYLRIYEDVTEGLAGRPAEMRKAFRRAYENRDAPEPRSVDVPVTTLERTRQALLDEGFDEDSFQVEWYDRQIERFGGRARRAEPKVTGKAVDKVVEKAQEAAKEPTTTRQVFSAFEEAAQADRERRRRWSELATQPRPSNFDVYPATRQEYIERAQGQYLVMPENARKVLEDSDVRIRVAENLDLLAGNPQAGVVMPDGRQSHDTSHYTIEQNDVYIAAGATDGSINVLAHECGHALDFNILERNPVTVTWQEPGGEEKTFRPYRVHQDVYLTWAHNEFIANNPDVDSYYRVGAAGNTRAGRMEWIAEGFAAMVEGDDDLLQRISGGSKGADIFRWTMRRLGLL